MKYVYKLNNGKELKLRLTSGECIEIENASYDSFKDEKSSLKMSVALNEIINRNNKKEENKRKYLKKNKAILLNSFSYVFTTFKPEEIKKIFNPIIENNDTDNLKYSIFCKVSSKQ